MCSTCHAACAPSCLRCLAYEQRLVLPCTRYHACSTELQPNSPGTIRPVPCTHYRAAVPACCPSSTIHPVLSTQCHMRQFAWYHPPGTMHTVPCTHCTPSSTIHPVLSTQCHMRQFAWYHPPGTMHTVPCTRYHSHSTAHLVPRGVGVPPPTLPCTRYHSHMPRTLCHVAWGPTPYLTLRS